MKHALLTASLLLATLSVLPTATAADPAAPEMPVSCHGPLDGYQSCEVEQGSCHAGDEYVRGDVHVHAECQPTDGKSRCGVDAYHPPLLVTYHCFLQEGQLWPPRDVVALPASAPAPPCPVEHQVAPGFYEVDLHCGPLVDCHLNNVEDSTRTCVSDAAACAEDALGLDAGTPYTEQGCHDAACATPTGPVADPERCVLPPGVGLPARASAPASASACRQYPGYERCDYTAGPCTVTTYYYYHDAFYVVDGPRCDKPTASGADQPVQCWGLDGLLACEAQAGPCHAGFRYWRGEVEDVHAQCFS